MVNSVNGVSGILIHIWDGLQGDEPADSSVRWLEVINQLLFLGRIRNGREPTVDFAKAAWNY